MSENPHPDFAAAERIARFEEQNSREYDANGPREITQLARAYLALSARLATHHARIVEAVEGVTNYTFTEQGEPLVPINDILAALAALDPRGGR